MLKNNWAKQLLSVMILLGIIALPNTLFAQADKIYEQNNKAVAVVTYDKDENSLTIRKFKHEF